MLSRFDFVLLVGGAVADFFQQLKLDFNRQSESIFKFAPIKRLFYNCY